MAENDILDLTLLLAPISAENPTGVDLREDSDFIKLKDARKTARTAEKQSEVDSTADAHKEWQVIRKLAPVLLASRSKDLTVAVWLAEALVRCHGFVGLRAGLQLLQGLLQTFWDGLYPREDEEGIETKIAPLSGLFGSGSNSPLVLVLRKVPLTQADDPGPFASWHYDVAVANEKIEADAKRKQDIAAGKILLPATIATCFRRNETEFTRTLARDLGESLIWLDRLDQSLAGHCGVAAPSVWKVKETLEQILGLVRHLGAGLLEEEAVPVVDDPVEPNPTVVKKASRSIASREDAFKLLQDVAAYFESSEPQSLVPWMLENVIFRGRLPLRDLLLDLIPDEKARKDIYVRGGMKLSGDSAAVRPTGPAAGDDAVEKSDAPPIALASREEGFAVLRDVAAFFQHAEPQSLVPWMLENVVRRGRLPLRDLLIDLVPEEKLRKELYLRGGMAGVEDS